MDVDEAILKTDPLTLPGSSIHKPEDDADAPAASKITAPLTAALPDANKDNPSSLTSPGQPQAAGASQRDPGLGRSESVALLLDDSPPRTDTMQSMQATQEPRSLNVNDALGYLDAVKVQFQDQPPVYNHFLDIMKEFKSQRIDTPGVIERVSHLFYGHQDLISGFNTFLPAGYHIACSSNNSITVTSPAGLTVIHPHPLFFGPPQPPPPPPPPQRPPSPYRLATEAPIGPAFEYIQKIKRRCDADTYKQFLDILSRYHHHQPHNIDEEEVSVQISRLFKNDPDLRADFHHFMPDMADVSSRKMEAVLPQKRKRKDKEKERDREREREKEREREARAASHHKSKKKSSAVHPVPHQSSKQERRHAPAPPIPPPRSDDSRFFERVRRSLDSQESYNEFLKIINLYTQNMIDTGRLVRETRHFIMDPELMKQFREILGWDDRREREYIQWERDQPYGFTRPMVSHYQDRPTRQDMGVQYGSYRRLAPSEANVSSAGRDEMCRSVLNDEWVSHPTWSSEDPPIVSQRKNIFEEALHRSEEERHEYDFHIEAITRTIAILEPINNKIAQLTPEERASFKLKANLNGSVKTINHRVIKKIWGREGGAEIVAAMQEMPSQAIPAVLHRLKSKEEEWKRAQREWNKVWREVEARNYVKSLDQQAITFKTQDKKALTVKALVSQVEAAREEQLAASASVIDPLFKRTRPRHQLEFVVDDVGVLQDVLKLTFSYLDRTQGQLGKDERRKIEQFLKVFVPLFFMQDAQVFCSAFDVGVVPGLGESDVDMSDVSDADVSSASSARGGGSSKGKRATTGGDLRKKLLKSEQAKSASRKTRNSGSASRMASPQPMEIDPHANNNASRNGLFFTNTTYYVLLRLLEVLHSRLSLFRDLSAEKTIEPTHPTAVALGLVDAGLSPDTNCYDLLLESCERLFDNDLEQSLFEDQMRHVFGVKDAYKIFTIDKVIASLIKQVQNALSDTKSVELFGLLKRDRGVPVMTPQDQINSRHAAEKILGPDENLFRIDWLPESKTMTIQLIGKDDSSFDNSEVLTARWEEYISAFQMSGPTSEGLQAKLRRPFLRRNLPSGLPETKALSSDGLEIKVCIRTYRLFFVSYSEDYFSKIRQKEETQKVMSALRLRTVRRKKWMDDRFGLKKEDPSSGGAMVS